METESTVYNGHQAFQILTNKRQPAYNPGFVEVVEIVDFVDFVEYFFERLNISKRLNSSYRLRKPLHGMLVLFVQGFPLQLFSD